MNTSKFNYKMNYENFDIGTRNKAINDESQNQIKLLYKIEDVSRKILNRLNKQLKDQIVGEMEICFLLGKDDQIYLFDMRVLYTKPLENGKQKRVIITLSNKKKVSKRIIVNIV